MHKDKIKQLNHQLKENIELVFDDLGLDFEYGDLESVRGPCPVHEGHNNICSGHSQVYFDMRHPE